MIYEFACWVLNTRPMMAVRHAHGLDHSPSLSAMGTCPCKSCVRANPNRESVADAFRRGLRGQP